MIARFPDPIRMAYAFARHAHPPHATIFAFWFRPAPFYFGGFRPYLDLSHLKSLAGLEPDVPAVRSVSFCGLSLFLVADLESFCGLSLLLVADVGNKV